MLGGRKRGVPQQFLNCLQIGSDEHDGLVIAVAVAWWWGLAISTSEEQGADQRRDQT